MLRRPPSGKKPRQSYTRAVSAAVAHRPYKPGVAGSIPAPPTTAIAASRLTFPAARLRDLHLALGLGAGSGAGSFLGRAGEALLDAGDIGLIVQRDDTIPEFDFHGDRDRRRAVNYRDAHRRARRHRPRNRAKPALVAAHGDHEPRAEPVARRGRSRVAEPVMFDVGDTRTSPPSRVRPARRPRPPGLRAAAEGRASKRRGARRATRDRGGTTPAAPHRRVPGPSARGARGVRSATKDGGCSGKGERRKWPRRSHGRSALDHEREAGRPRSTPSAGAVR